MEGFLALFIFVLSLSFIPSIEHIDVSSLFFLFTGFLVALSIFKRNQYWRYFFITYCALYLLFVMPSLVSLAQKGGGIFHLISVITKTMFQSGFKLDSAFIFWHLFILSALFLLILCLVVLSSFKARWGNKNGNILPIIQAGHAKTRPLIQALMTALSR